MDDQAWETLKKSSNSGQQKRPIHRESKLQQSCVKWFRLQYPRHVLFAIPNGGWRSKTEAAIMNGEGVLAGVADLFLMCPRKGYCGLFIEMKVEKNKQTDSQVRFATLAESFGYKYEVANSLESFINSTKSYLNS